MQKMTAYIVSCKVANMFGLFSSKHENRDDVESTDDAESSECSEIFDKSIASSVVRLSETTTFKVTYHLLEIRSVVQYLPTWCFNRKINEEHKNTIKEGIRKSHHIMGSIQLVKDVYHVTRVINGQHRVKALQEIIADDIDMSFDMKVMFEVYHIDVDLEDFESCQDSIESLFSIANNNLNVKLDDDQELFCKKITRAVMTDSLLQKGFVDKSEGSVHKPRCLARDLYESLKEHLPSTVTQDPVEVVKRIKEINKKLQMMSLVELFGRASPAESKMKHYKKAQRLRFFLNLDCKYPLQEWIKMI